VPEPSIAEKGRFLTQIEFEISCQNNNQKLVRADYIYLKIGEKAKRQTLSNGFALMEKRYHTKFKTSKTCHL